MGAGGVTGLRILSNGGSGVILSNHGATTEDAVQAGPPNAGRERDADHQRATVPGVLPGGPEADHAGTQKGGEVRYPTAKLDMVRLFMGQFDRLQRTEGTTVEDWVALKLSCSIEEAARLVEAVKRLNRV